MIRQLIILALLWFVPFISRGETLTFDGAIQMALHLQPALLALEATSRAQQEDAMAKRQLPNPKLTFGVQNMPIEGTEYGSLNSEDMTMITLGVMQDVVPKGKRDLAAQWSITQARQTDDERALLERTIRRDTGIAWLDVYYAWQWQQQIDRLIDELTTQRDVTVAQSRALPSAQETLAIDSMIAMLQNTQIEAKRTEKQARAALSRWINEASNLPLAKELPAMAVNVALSDRYVKIDEHPALRVARYNMELSKLEADSARLASKSDWSWELMYGKRQSGRSDMLTVQISRDLPWNNNARQGKQLEEKLALIAAADAQWDDRKKQLIEDLRIATANWEAAQARDRQHREKIAVIAQAQLQIAEAAYRTGKATFRELQEARRNLIDVQREHLRIQIDFAQASLQLSFFD